VAAITGYVISRRGRQVFLVLVTNVALGSGAFFLIDLRLLFFPEDIVYTVTATALGVVIRFYVAERAVFAFLQVGKNFIMTLFAGFG
jgi:hypothetical protein